jgi:hypothetical protein
MNSAIDPDCLIAWLKPASCEMQWAATQQLRKKSFVKNAETYSLKKDGAFDRILFFSDLGWLTATFQKTP